MSANFVGTCFDVRLLVAVTKMEEVQWSQDWVILLGLFNFLAQYCCRKV